MNAVSDYLDLPTKYSPRSEVLFKNPHIARGDHISTSQLSTKAENSRLEVIDPLNSLSSERNLFRIGVRPALRKLTDILINLPRKGTLYSKWLYGLTRKYFVNMAGGAVLFYGLRRSDTYGIAFCIVGLGLFTGTSRREGTLRSVESDRGKILKSEVLFLIGMTSLALLVRLFILWRFEFIISPDGVYYVSLGKNLIRGSLEKGLSTYWSPLYPVSVGIATLIFKDPELAGRLVSVLAGGLLVIPTYFLTRTLYGKEVAYIAAILVATNRLLIRYSTLLLTESIYILLLLAAISLGLSAFISGKGGRFMLAGLALGMCYLLRPEAIFYASLLFALVLGLRFFAPVSSFQIASSHFFNILSGLIPGVLPYILYLRKKTGKWTISDKLHAHLEQTNSWEKKWLSIRKDYDLTWADIFYAGSRPKDRSIYEALSVGTERINLAKFASETTKALGVELWILFRHMLPIHFLILIGLGLFKTTWFRDTYLMLFVISTLIGYAMFPADVHDRFLLPLLPVLVCWVSKGIIETRYWLRKALAHIDTLSVTILDDQKLLQYLTIMCAAFSLFSSIRYSAKQTLFQPFEHKLAGLWIKKHSSDSPLIMATGPGVAYYAGGRPLYLPAEEYQTFLEYAKRKKPDYIIIDERVMSNGLWGNHEYEPLKFLLDEYSYHPGLELIYRNDEIQYNKILVFQLTENNRAHLPEGSEKSSQKLLC